MKKSLQSFQDAGYTANQASQYATLSFFCGFFIVFLLDQIVHLIMHFMERRRDKALAASQSRAVLLNAEDATDNDLGTASPRSAPGPTTVLDATSDAANAASAVATAVGPAAGCTSRCPPSPEVLGAAAAAAAAADDSSSGSEKSGDEEEGNAQQMNNTPGSSSKRSCFGKRKKKEGGTAVGESGSREAPAPIMEMIENDPHNFALKKMGILTCIAIALHNFPEGLLTFSATLADATVGVGVCIAIALHNAPEGAVIALPIYYATGSRRKAFLWATASGLSEPIGALVGWAALSSGADLAFAIVFAVVAGMMVMISLKELVPMALRYDPKDSVATTSVVVGMVVMAASLLLFTL
jgi:ZIP family zinc transporter